MREWWNRHKIKVAVPVVIVYIIAEWTLIYLAAGLEAVLVSLLGVLVMAGVLGLSLWYVKSQSE